MPSDWLIRITCGALIGHVTSGISWGGIPGPGQGASWVPGHGSGAWVRGMGPGHGSEGAWVLGQGILGTGQGGHGALDPGHGPWVLGIPGTGDPGAGQ